MKIKNTVLGIAIIILTIFVTFYGINTLFSKPQYEDFCGGDKTQAVIDTAESCEEIGGLWSEFEGPKPVDREYEGWCDRDSTCRGVYEDALKKRSRNVFFVALPLGIIIVAVGAVVFGLEVVGAGLMGGGVGTLIYGAGAYWPYTENWIRFLLSLVGLVAVIWIAYWFNKKYNKK